MKSTQTVVAFPAPPASMPDELFADFEITGRKRPSAFVASYGIQVIVMALLLIITLTTTAPVLIQKKYSAISLVAPTLSEPFSSAATHCPDLCPAGSGRLSGLPAVAAPMQHSGSAHTARRTDGGCPRAAGAEACASAQFAGRDSCDARRKARPYRLLRRSQWRTRATADQRDQSRSGTCSGREFWNPGYGHRPPDGKRRGYRSIWHAEQRFWPGKQSREERGLQ